MFTALFCLVAEPDAQSYSVEAYRTQMVIKQQVLHDWLREKTRRFAVSNTHEVLGGWLENYMDRKLYVDYKPKAICPRGIVSYAVIRTTHYDELVEEFFASQRGMVAEKAGLENVLYDHLYKTELRKSMMRRSSSGNVIYPEIWLDE